MNKYLNKIKKRLSTFINKKIKKSPSKAKRFINLYEIIFRNKNLLFLILALKCFLF